MAESKKSTLHPIRMFFSRLAASLAIICCSILIITASIGVFRGYSVQSTILPWLVPVAMLCIVVYWMQGNFKLSIIGFVYSVIMIFMIISILQCRHYSKGRKLYNEGFYEEAATEFEKETQLWYLKLRPNISETGAMNMLAKSYCQLEEFGKAREIYELSSSRYKGTVHGKLPVLSLKAMDSALVLLSGHIEESLKRQDDYKLLYAKAGIYELSLSCNKKAIEIYKKITEMSIPAEKKSRAYEAIKRLR